MPLSQTAVFYTNLPTSRHGILIAPYHKRENLTEQWIPAIKVVDSCWISSTEWSDTFRSFFVYGKKQESRKKHITVEKNFTFLRRFDRKNTLLGISRNLIDKLVFK